MKMIIIQTNCGVSAAKLQRDSVLVSVHRLVEQLKLSDYGNESLRNKTVLSKSVEIKIHI